ncbi:MAG: CDP-diacylglycerol---glycerol-3-phosphate 3-phosphatidyltransferase [Solirubrobacteraceae bacterium]|nr:CDP-diacylglycerol---glycerol-3-phosphate 3-phosphatidyltransferase [Solirubrobacteraceae bacterium]MEA2395910.1 CDP-diacylglycerol---glycerol-3-phosphate 3-phosphatidyltransferase [Solirubrobacteraceae bacterium]
MGTRISSVPSLRSAWVLNAGTLLRIVLTPVVMALVLLADERALACVLFVVAAATDWFDGYLARRWNVTTTLGSFLDTTADKLLVSGVLVALVSAQRASPWLAAIIIAREIVILGLRGVVAVDGTVMQASYWARIKTTVQCAAIALAIVRPGGQIAGAHLDEWALLIATVITVTTAVDYLRRFAAALTAP